MFKYTNLLQKYCPELFLPSSFFPFLCPSLSSIFLSSLVCSSILCLSCSLSYPFLPFCLLSLLLPLLPQAMLETVSTLKFANRAKNIRNEAKVNEDLDQKSLLRKYERELKKLRAELEERSKNVVDKRRLLELDEQVNR